MKRQRVTFRVGSGAVAALDALAGDGRFGDGRHDVARLLVLEGLRRHLNKEDEPDEVPAVTGIR